MVGVCEKLFSVSEGFQKWLDGCNNAMGIVMILVLAWGLSKISSALDLKGIVGNIIANTGFPPLLSPLSSSWWALSSPSPPAVPGAPPPC